MTLRKSYQAMIKAVGVPDMATLMDMTESSLDNRVYERKGQGFSVRESLRMQQVSKTTHFAEAVATESGGTFVLLPDVEALDNDAMLAMFNELHAQIGALSAEFAEDIKDDEIDERERVRLEKIGGRIHQATEKLLALTFRIYCRTPPAA